MSLRAGVLAIAVALGLFGAAAWFKRDSTVTTPENSTTNAEQRQRVRSFWEAQREATQHRIAGRTREAVASYQRALALDPDHEDALYYGGATHLTLGDAAQARDLWQHLVRVNPVSNRAHHQLGDLYLCLDYPEILDLTAAEAEFRRALEINQEETGPLLQLAEVRMARAQWDSATTLLSTLLISNPGSQQALFYRGFLAWRDNRRREALVDYRAAITLSAPADAAPTGLTEGETATGGAMLAERERCQQFEDQLDGIGDEPDDGTHMDDRYRGVAQMLGAYGG